MLLGKDCSARTSVGFYFSLKARRGKKSCRALASSSALQTEQMNVFWRSFCPSSAPLLLAGRSNCARGERTHAETDVQSQSASFRPWCGLVSPLFPPSLARLLAPDGVKLAPESEAGSWNVTFCSSSSSSPPPPLGASLNLSPGTDGQFGPLDLANERVVPGGVGYKDIG